MSAGSTWPRGARGSGRAGVALAGGPIDEGDPIEGGLDGLEQLDEAHYALEAPLLVDDRVRLVVEQLVPLRLQHLRHGGVTGCDRRYKTLQDAADVTDGESRKGVGWRPGRAVRLQRLADGEVMRHERADAAVHDLLDHLPVQLVDAIGRRLGVQVPG